MSRFRKRHALQEKPAHSRDSLQWMASYFEHADLQVVSCVKASLHQGHPVFGEYAGSQCTCNSLSFLLHSQFTAVFRSQLLDTVLHEGMQIYNNAHYTGYLMISELPAIVTLRYHKFSVTYDPSFSGDIFSSTVDPRSPFKTLSDALHCTMLKSNNALITIDNNPGSTCAIHRTASFIYLFDAHARDARGLPHPQGTAVLLKFRTQSAVIAQLKQCTQHLIGSRLTCPFEIAPVTIKDIPITPPDISKPQADASDAKRVRKRLQKQRWRQKEENREKENKQRKARQQTKPENASGETRARKCRNKQRWREQNRNLEKEHLQQKARRKMKKLNTQQKNVNEASGTKQQRTPKQCQATSTFAKANGHPAQKKAPKTPKSPDECRMENRIRKQRWRRDSENRAKETAQRNENRAKETAQRNKFHNEKTLGQVQSPAEADATRVSPLTENAMDTVIENFRKKCKENMPVYECCCCMRFMFRHQVTTFDAEKFTVSRPSVRSLVNSTCNSSSYICSTCKRHLLASKLPPQATANNLELDPLPQSLQMLNALERHLISPVIPFMKILPLPKTFMKGLHGPCVCVPSNVSAVTDILPRSLDDTSLIKVKLKRKMDYKGHHMFQAIDPANMLASLKHLQENHPAFKEILVDTQWLPSFNPSATTDAISGSTTSTAHLSVDADNLCQTATSVDEPVPQHDHDVPVDMLKPHTNPSETGDGSPTVRTLSTDSSVAADFCQTDLSAGDTASQHAFQVQQIPEEHNSSAPQFSCLRNEDQTISLAPAQGQIPIPIFDIEAKAFACHFPSGRNSISTARHVKLGSHAYFNSRLFSKDNRFASDPEYIFYALDYLEKKTILSSTSMAIRKASPTSLDTPITAEMLIDSEQRSRILKTDLGYRFLETIRGSPVYWQKTLRDLMAMVKQLGVPTWFCSFSAADRHWVEIPIAILKQRGQEIPRTLSWADHCKLINSNPVTACRMFEERVRLFIRHVLLSSSHPLGQIKDYFYRTEFQARGWPHIHALFWVKDAPKFSPGGDNTDFIAMVDQYITTSMPDPLDEADLHTLVTTLQMHSTRHSRSCAKGSKKCRFNFPRPPADATFIAQPAPHEEADKKAATESLKKLWDILEHPLQMPDSFAEILSELGIDNTQYMNYHNILTQRNTIIYKRDPQDAWINPYNKMLLKSWNANIDIQPVLDPYSCVMYIVSYISKAERELGDLLKQAQQELREGNLQPLQQMRKLGNVFIGNRDVGLMESVYRVTGMRLKASTRETVFIPSDPYSARLTKPIAMLKTKEKDDEDVWQTSLLDRYLARPKSSLFTNICLAEFASCYKVIYGQQIPSSRQHASDSEDDTVDSNVYVLSNDLGYIRKRKTPAVIRYVRFKQSNDPERYFANILRVYWPHSSKELKPSSSPSFQAFFETPIVQQATLENMRKFEKASEQVDEAWTLLQQQPNLDDAWSMTAPLAETARIEEAVEQEQLNDLHEYEDIPTTEIPELDSLPQPTTVTAPSASTAPTISSTPSIANLLNSMNHQQQQLFHFTQLHALSTIHGKHLPPYYIFLNGGAGTGKSHVIHAISHQLQKIYSSLTDSLDQVTVLKLAATGTAAFNIGGQTVHSALKISPGSTKPLSENELNSIRTRYSHMQLIIIDEISMIPQHLLAQVHLRLQQIKNCTSSDTWFGNTSILAVGDFHQIPPVRGQILCKAISLTNIFMNIFSRYQLTQVMRQKNDQPFAEFLNRLRLHSKDDPVDQRDLSILQGAIVDSSSPHISSYLHVFSRNIDVSLHNEAKLHDLPAQLVTLTAKDHVTVQGKTYKRKSPFTPAQLRTEPLLPATLLLKEGARAMLTANIDVKDGLANGVLGTITKIPQSSSDHLPPYIAIHFDNESVGRDARSSAQLSTYPNSVIIRPHSEQFKHNNSQVTRTQYPFKLAYAVTIHKVQGQTVDNVVISMDNIFKNGMAYVALSRVTSQQGLNITDLNLSSIYTHPDIEPMISQLQPTEATAIWKQLMPPQELLHDIIKIASFNIESLSAHLCILLEHYYLSQLDIFLLQETWITTHPPTIPPTHQLLSLPRRNAYRNDIAKTSQFANAERGGVAILATSHAILTPIPTPPLNAEIQAYLLTSPSTPIQLVNCYRPPTLSMEHFLDQLLLLLPCLDDTQPTIIAGDFNIDVLKQPSSSLTTLMTDHHFTQAIRQPTTKHNTLIDHVYCRNILTYNSTICPVTFGLHHAAIISM